MSYIQGLNHCGITVQDMNESLQFYQDILGLIVLTRQETDQQYAKDLVGLPELKSIDKSLLKLPDDQVLELLEFKGIKRNSGSTAPKNYGSGHICLNVTNLEKLFIELMQQNITFLSNEVVTITHGVNEGRKVVYMLDPDGYIIELVE